MENPVVRMVICDVDGTLLNKDETSVSESVYSAIHTCHACGVQFAVASGRCYLDLKTLFEPVLSNTIFICSDGTLAVHKEKVLYSCPIKKDLAEKIASQTNVLDGECTLVYGKDTVYGFGPQFGPGEVQKVSSIDEISEPVYKIAFYGLSPLSKCKVRGFAERSGRLTEVYADKNWTEFIPSGTDKGSAAAAVQTQMGISVFETAAFGDNRNDFGMLRQARLSFASPAAVPEIKRMCKFQAENVTDEIFNILRER